MTDHAELEEEFWKALEDDRTLLPGLPGRYPALALDPHQSILPAFSAFTGGWLLEDDRSWIACAHGELVAQARDQRRAPAADA